MVYSAKYTNHTLLQLTAILRKEGKLYSSLCPELGVASQGKNAEDAVKNLKEAVDLYLESAAELGVLKEKLMDAGIDLGEDKSPIYFTSPFFTSIPSIK